MKRGPDAASALCRSLGLASERAGCPATLRLMNTSPYASATFEGVQLRIALDAPPSIMLNHWLEALPDQDIVMPGHVVAGIVVTTKRQAGFFQNVTIDALVLVLD